MDRFTLTNANDKVSQYPMGQQQRSLRRIFSFTIHKSHPTGFHLAVQLENGPVYYNRENAAERVHECDNINKLFSICQTNARTLLYSEIPRFYTLSESFQCWKQGTTVEDHPHILLSDALGHIYTMHSNNDKYYYLRLLLVIVGGPTSFQ